MNFFIKHRKEKYNNQFPVWVILEVITFGLLSKIYSNLKTEDKKEVAKTYYQLPYVYIQSWIRTLSVFRNRCAHYNRIYNKKLTIRPRLFKQDYERGINNETLFAVLLIIGRLIRGKMEWRTFVINLKALIEKYEEVDVKLMGFLDNWEDILENIY